MKNGLVAYYDPYRDAYGRNVLPVGAENFVRNSGIGDWWYWNYNNSGSGTVTTGQSDPFGGNGAVKLQGASGTTGFWRHSGDGIPKAGVKFVASCYVKAITADGVKITSYAGLRATESIITPEMGWVLASMVLTGDGTSALAMSIAAGGGTSLECYAYHPQINLGPVLHAYSAPAGAPGTLQTGTDYSGAGNTLTLGATTGASTDDPVNTGTAWSFDGGDYLLCNGLRDALKGKTEFTLAVVLNQSSLAATRGILSGAATGSLVLGVNFVDDATSPYYPAIIVNDGSTSAKVVLTAYATGQNDVLFARFRGGAELSLRRNLDAWVTDTTSIPPNVKSAITVDWAIGGFDIAGAIEALVGTMPAFLAWTRYMGDGEIARTYRYIKSLMAGRGVTVA